MRRTIALAALSIVLAGCSLLVSTSDLTGGPKATVADGGAEAGDHALAVEGGEGADASDAAPDGEGGAPVSEPSLRGAWNFEDGSPADVSGKGHDGRLTGDAKITSTSFGQSLQLQGAGSMDVSSLSAVSFPPTGTFLVRFKWSSMNVDVEDGILDEWEPGRDHLYFRHPNGQDPGTMQIAFQKADTSYIFVTSFDVPKDVWTLVAITWDTTNRKGAVFVEGNKIYGGSWDGSWTPIDQHLRLGLNLHGYVDDVRLYDRVLTGSEIEALR